MSIVVYRPPKLGDENQISGCMWASADLCELTGGTSESVAEWLQICDPEELRDRILSGEKTLVATWNEIVVGFIAFKRGNHLSLLFVRKEFARQGVGRELFTQCAHDLDEATVNAAEAAVGFYQKIGFKQNGDRFFKNGVWATPMKWVNPTVSLLPMLRELEYELHQPKCRGDRERLAQLLAPDFKEFGRSGASYTRVDTLMRLPQEPEPEQIHAQDFAITKLSDSIALLTYRSAYMKTSGELSNYTNRSSIWRLGSSGWQMVFHQGTPTDPFDQSTV